MTMKTIKVAEATERQLDWLVARIEGDEWPKDGGKGLDYSTDWACGGPIIERELIDVLHVRQNDLSVAWGAAFGDEVVESGPTFLIAAMRCYATSKLGMEAEVPEELT